MRTRHVLAILSPVALLLGSAQIGCSSPVSARGSGTLKQEVRPVRGFGEVEISNAIHAEIDPGPDYRVEVSGDDNLVPHIVTRLEDGDKRLVVRAEDHFRLSPRLPMQVKITVPAGSLHAVSGSGAVEVRAAGLGPGDVNVSASGASQVSVTDLRGAHVRLVSSGASGLTVSGEAARVDAEVSGASHLRARDLRGGRVSVNASGASGAAVCATDAVDAEASGASAVDHYCGASKVQERSSGASSIHRH